MKITGKLLLKISAIVLMVAVFAIPSVVEIIYLKHLLFSELDLDRSIQRFIHRNSEACPKDCVYIDDYDVTIRWDLDSMDEETRKSFKDEKIGLKPIDPKYINKSIQAVEMSLKAYPKDFVKVEIDTVYIVGNMDFDGANSAGTFGYRSLYLVNKGDHLGYTKNFIVDSFHHEFAHLLHANYYDYLDEEEWNSVNLDSFTYGSGGRDAILNNNYDDFSEEDFFHKGFMSGYATSAFQEDFAVSSAALFGSPKKTLNIAKKYPIIEKKMKLVKEFYHRIDSRFTQEYFENL